MIRPPDTDDDGAAVVEFVMVVGFLLIPLFLGLLQLGMVLHARNVIVASAAAGARVGANADSNEVAGAAEACRRITDSLSQEQTDLVCTGSYVSSGGDDAVELVEVRVSGPVPMFFLPFGGLNIDIAGHAVREIAP